MADQCTPIPPNMALIAGPQLLGHLFNWGLFGVLTVQVYIYHLAFRDDTRYIKALVYSIYVLECLQIVMATHDVFAMLGAGWGDLDALNDPHWLWFDTPVMSGIISATVQIFFAWRIYRLSKSKLLSLFICALAVAQGVGAIVTGILVHLIESVSEIQARTFESNIVWLGGSALCDIIIASCMFFFLSKAQTGYHGTDQLISRLIRLTVETGLITASVAILDLTLFFVFQHNNLHIIPSTMLAKLYTNSLMALFNSRVQISKRGATHSDSVVPKPVNLGFSPRYRSGVNGFNPRSNPGTITVDVTKETITDIREHIAMVDMDEEDLTHDLQKLGRSPFSSPLHEFGSEV